MTKHLLLTITGILTSLSLVAPAFAANVDVLTFDTASGNGSLAARIQDRSIDARVVENYTVHDMKTRAPLKFDEVGYNINWRELRKYVQQYLCKKGDQSKCMAEKAF